MASNGFDLSTQGQPKRLAKETRNQHSQVVAELNDELFMEYLTPGTDHSLPKFTKLIYTLVYLQPPANDPQVLIRFKDIIMDKWKRADHDAVIRFLKSTQYVENKLMEGWT